MSVYDSFRGRAKPKPYAPAAPTFTVEQRLDECLRIADLIERGKASPVDEIELVTHLRVLRGTAGHEPWCTDTNRCCTDEGPVVPRTTDA